MGPIFSDDDTPDLTNSVRRRALRQSASDARRKQPVPVFSEDESVAPASDSQRTPRHNNAKLGTSRAQSDSAQVARSDATKLETEIAAPSAAAFVCRLLVLLALAGLLIWLVRIGTTMPLVLVLRVTFNQYVMGYVFAVIHPP